MTTTLHNDLMILLRNDTELISLLGSAGQIRHQIAEEGTALPYVLYDISPLDRDDTCAGIESQDGVIIQVVGGKVDSVNLQAIRDRVGEIVLSLRGSMLGTSLCAQVREVAAPSYRFDHVYDRVMWRSEFVIGWRG